MKRLILILLLLPATSFGQEIIGLWSKSPGSSKALEFKADGSFDIIDFSNPESKVLTNLTITYKLSDVNGITYIEYSAYH